MAKDATKKPPKKTAKDAPGATRKPPKEEAAPKTKAGGQDGAKKPPAKPRAFPWETIHGLYGLPPLPPFALAAKKGLKVTCELEVADQVIHVVIPWPSTGLPQTQHTARGAWIESAGALPNVVGTGNNKKDLELWLDVLPSLANGNLVSFPTSAAEELPMGQDPLETGEVTRPVLTLTVDVGPDRVPRLLGAYRGEFQAFILSAVKELLPGQNRVLTMDGIDLATAKVVDQVKKKPAAKKTRGPRFDLNAVAQRLAQLLTLLVMERGDGELMFPQLPNAVEERARALMDAKRQARQAFDELVDLGTNPDANQELLMQRLAEVMAEAGKLEQMLGLDEPIDQKVLEAKGFNGKES